MALLCKAAIFTALLLAPLVVCQSDETSASIIQTTIMTFRVTGSGVSNFSSNAQSDFSNNLRSLLSSFNFMSIAVSDYKAGNGYVDVSARAVDATDAQNCTQTWSKIANQVVVTGTFTTTFNALLTNSGVKMNSTLLSIAGDVTPAGSNVTFLVNMTLSGGSGLTPFSTEKQQNLLAPITSFLGDHGTASIASSTPRDNAVDVTLNVTLDANTMPQFWLFISNQTTLQSSLPSLGGSNLQTTANNFTVLGSAAAAPAPAGTPPAPVPASGGTSSSGTVTAQQATGVSNVPPVSTSSSGTVTMNIDMTLYGSAIQPFTNDKQFAAASSMASVFWIIVGTGSVNVVTFSAYNATGQPASTAKGTTPQYGRKMLQADSNIPAENVTFAVTLPTATQNSLLVLQSSSDTVKQQFAGWFVTQMASRGLTVDANVNKVGLSGVNTNTSPAAQAPSTSSTPGTSSSSTSKGSGTNVGAIVGGVVGGVVGAALLAFLAYYAYSRNQRKKSMEANKGAAFDSDSSGDLKNSMYWDPAKRSSTSSPIYTKDAEDLRRSIISVLSDTDSSYVANSPFHHSPLHSNMTELSSDNADNVKALVRRKQQESKQLTETSAHKAEALMSALSALELGSLYYNKYVIEKDQRKGLNSVIAYGVLKEDDKQQVAIKFLPDPVRFEREKLFYENRQALEGDAAAHFIPVMLDAFEGSYSIDTRDMDTEIPPALVLERGSFTLSEYLSGKASLRGKPAEVDRGAILRHLCKGIEFLHARSLVHGSLSTDHFMWFPEAAAWKVLGFTTWARSRENAPLDYDLRYAAPEFVLADLAKMSKLPARESADMWALGCIAYEVLSGQPLFGPQYQDEEIMGMLIGFVKLPWEANPDFFTDTLPPAGRSVVADLLQRAPEARKPITTVLHSPLFVAHDSESLNTARVMSTLDIKTPHNLDTQGSDWL